MCVRVKFELSSLDLRVIVNEIRESLPGRVVQVYRGLDGSILLRIRGDEGMRDLRLAPGRAVFMAPGVYRSLGETDENISHLRRFLKGIPLNGIYQVAGERVAGLVLGRGDRAFRLIVEVYPGGGACLVDGEGTVVFSTSHRLGARYVPPASRQTASTKEEALKILLATEGGTRLGVALARDLGLGSKYSDEVAARAGVEPAKPVSMLSHEELERISLCIEEIHEFTNNPRPVAYREGGEYVAFAPFPLVHLSGRGLEEVRVSSLNEAVTLAYHSYLRLSKRAEVARRIEEEARRVEREIKEKLGLAEQLRGRAEELTTIARSLYLRIPELKELWDSIRAGRPQSQLGFKLDKDSARVIIDVDGRDVALSLLKPITHQIDEMFHNAKKTMMGVENLMREVEKLKEHLSNLAGARPATLDEEILEVRRRASEWYKRYLWSNTSCGRLIVLGRDASSNIRLLKHHLEGGDLVFHAEVRGSPVAILKDGLRANERELEEAAALCGSYSRAWREELSSITVYWVRPTQISFSPPVGTYLPRGSFIVKPPKNYIHAQLQLCIGFSDKLGPIVGVEGWVSQEADVYAVIVPGRESASVVAKALLERITEWGSRKILPADFERLIPYGRCRVVRWSG